MVSTRREPETEPSERPPKVLLVSPEANFYRTVQRVLDRSGYEIEIADCGEVALRRLADERFDAVLTEVHLPGTLCGVGLLKEIRSRGFALPILVLTESETSRLRDAMRSANDVAALRKDANLDVLKSALRGLVSTR